MISGSLQTKGNMFYAVLSIKGENGKFKTKWVSLKIPSERGNKRKAKAELNRVIAEYESRDSVDYKSTLFCDYLRQWLDGHRANIEQVSYEGYRNILEKHVYPYFNELEVKLFDLKPPHIQDYYTSKHNKGGIGLSANTLKKHHALIRKCLQHALQMNLILYNPADRVTLPKMERFQGKAYTLEQAKFLLESSKGNVLEVPIVLALQFGLRRSEALGLKWSAVDFENEVVHIRHTVTAMNTRIERDGTKTLSSTRSLPMLGESKKYLLELRKKQEEEKLLFGAGYNDTNYVCRWADGKPYSPSIVSHNFGKFVERLGLPKLRYHDLRHSAASILISLGCNAKEVSTFLGHSQVSTTLNIYTHVFNSSSVALMQAYDSALSGASTQA